MHTERAANIAMSESNATTRRFARSLSDAFADERAIAVQRYLSNKPSHRLMRFLRRLVSYLFGARA